jgi:asparagine synthase (glutamine-hydrolysing)
LDAFQKLPLWLRRTLPEAMSPILPRKLIRWIERGNTHVSEINIKELKTMVWSFDPYDKIQLCPALQEISGPCQQIVEEVYAYSKTKDPLSKILYVYSKIWLAENLLMKADKMTMAHSVELRVPF